ncbi:GAP1-N2 domain-containing protein [Roseiconus lacunae]|uniref:GTPase-associated protein 1 N-terminal domain-containing protein n=1 Tax=Roseiconus lacunae TaxID=2605694 RepID=A0ABT7PME3_9BACT|nr:hypothetical protein [Roseiconus lacunae]MCD0458111.1 hypothetical protein [Roseiconus lacunae]MDM4017449.1 hypothetical protein [Roseiconus lacunae]WRQ53698.1 hypothetical protein U8335_14490 [Stieleria sp. HD01]
MLVEQITYGSANRSRMKGYQVIGQSPGIDASMSAAFCKLAPSHNSIETLPRCDLQDAWGLSFFTLSETHYVVARSVHGAPEYSGRGGFSVVTSALVATGRQLVQYGYHAIDFARTALALGHLILPADDQHQLPQSEMTDKPISLPLPESDFCDSTPAVLPNHAVNWIARETVSLLRDRHKVMIVGDCDALPILTLVFDQLNPSERSTTSFACGLKQSGQRDFRVQFTHETMTPKLKAELDRAGFVSIDIASVLVETR